MPEFLMRVLSAGLAIPLTLFLTYLGSFWFVFLVGSLFTVALYEWTCIFKKKIEKLNIFHFYLGVFYLFSSMAAYIYLSFLFSPFLLFWIFSLIWIGDTSAFLVGKAFGGPKLAPMISPNKTLSGFIGGCLIPTALTPIFAPFFGVVPYFSLSVTYVSAGIVLVGHAGDLFESWIKRFFGVKDSGTLIPGHGGILDRLDSLFLVGIFMWILVFLGVLDNYASFR